jgi:Fe2+ or Zn2+ uptake regulation protein
LHLRLIRSSVAPAGISEVTAPRQGPPLEAPDVDTAVDALRAAGLRVSAARRLVLEALYGASAPITADQIASGLAGRLPRSDLASVYRNLETLEEVGLVRHFHLGHGPGLYAPAGGQHEYLVCDSCNAVTAVDPWEMEPVRALICERFGYEARFSHFPILGLCAQCAREESAAHDSEE